MKKIILALSAIVILSSFVKNDNETIVLKDIDGTLLKSYPTIQKLNNEYLVTFKVDANTIVSSVSENNETHIYLVESGNSNVKKEYTLKLNTQGVDFSHYFEGNFDLAGLGDEIASIIKPRRPKYWWPSDN